MLWRGTFRDRNIFQDRSHRFFRCSGSLRRPSRFEDSTAATSFPQVELVVTPEGKRSSSCGTVFDIPDRLTCKHWFPMGGEHLPAETLFELGMRITRKDL